MFRRRGIPPNRRGELRISRGPKRRRQRDGPRADQAGRRVDDSLGDPIKTLGDHNIQIKIARDVTAHIKLTVAAKIA